jgi:hypothetical protein
MQWERPAVLEELSVNYQLHCVYSESKFFKFHCTEATHSIAQLQPKQAVKQMVTGCVWAKSLHAQVAGEIAQN